MLPSPAMSHDDLVGQRELGADGGRQAEAHGAQAARADELARLAAIVELRRPHLILAHFRGDDGLALAGPVDLADHVLRLEAAIVLPLQRVLALPLQNALVPLRMRRLRHLLHQRAKHVLHVAHDGQRHRDVLADLRRVDVDMDELGVRREHVQLAGDAVVKARADRDDQVGLVQRVVSVGGPVHARHAQAELVIVRESRPCPSASSSPECRACSASVSNSTCAMAAQMPPPAVDHRPLRRVDHLGRPLDHLRDAPRGWDDSRAGRPFPDKRTPASPPSRPSAGPPAPARAGPSARCERPLSSRRGRSSECVTR